MLKTFRNKNVARMVLWGILILILPAFVLWGTGSLGRSGKKGPSNVGIIDGKKVSFEDFAESLTSMRVQIILNYFNNPKVLESLLKNERFMGKLAWDRLIMLKKARAARIKVSDKEVVNAIGTHPLFVRDGRFESRAYEYFLKNSLGIFPRNFEELVRENLMIQKLADMLTKDVKITDEEIAVAYGRLNSKFKISYLMVPYSEFAGKTTVTEDEIKQYYEQHKQEFAVETKQAEEKGTVKHTAPLDEMRATIKSIIAENKARPMAIEFANKIYADLKDAISKENMPFEKAAAKLGLKVSESKVFARGDYLEGIGESDNIAAAASLLKSGDISQPIETRKGILIFRVTAVEPFDPEKFKKDKDAFAKQALVEKKNSFTEEWLREQEKNAHLNIDLNNYEKYYAPEQDERQEQETPID